MRHLPSQVGHVLSAVLELEVVLDNIVEVFVGGFALFQTFGDCFLPVCIILMPCAVGSVMRQCFGNLPVGDLTRPALEISIVWFI